MTDASPDDSIVEWALAAVGGDRLVSVTGRRAPAGMGHGCVWTAAIVGTVAAAVIGWSVWGFLSSFGPPRNRVAAADSRVCRSSSGNNVPFGEVMRHFRLKLPPSAQKVVFTANVSPLFGEYSLSLRFTTTSAGLQSFLSDAGLAPPSPDAQATVSFGAASCGLDPPATGRMAYSQDGAAGPMAKSPRAIAVDLSDPAHPTVWVAAMDL